MARAALQLDETGVNGSSFHAQTGQFRQDERGVAPGSNPPRAPGEDPGYLLEVVAVAALNAGGEHHPLAERSNPNGVVHRIDMTVAYLTRPDRPKA